MYRTAPGRYDSFVQRIDGWEGELGCSVSLAVETTGNARFFKNRMESEGFSVVVVNTNKFKVISQSTKKNDRGDAATLAYYLGKEMLPESHLADQSSGEELRRMIASYVGIMPSVHNSNETVHMGRITKYGPQELRTAFVQGHDGQDTAFQGDR